MSGTRPRFTSTAAPTEADVALWNSLTPEEQRAELERSLAASSSGGRTRELTKEAVILAARTRAAS